MEKRILKPGDEIGSIIIPTNITVEMIGPRNHDDEMKIFHLLKIITKEELQPNITCACKNKKFLWTLEAHQRGLTKKNGKAFTFRVQITCDRCFKSTGTDIGPSIDCYSIIIKNRIQGLKLWSNEIEKIFNDYFSDPLRK